MVKVLDFGLAKALDPAGPAAANATISPTLSLHATRTGVILGTAAYMAPEQARGRSVDTRADVWSFGCVLFEMLTGRRAFDAADVTDTLIAVLTKDPDWTLLPAPAAPVRPLLARCLRKDPRQRLQSIGDARIHVEELLAGPPADMTPAATPRLPAGGRLTAAFAAVAVTAAAITGLATWSLTRFETPEQVTPTRVEIAVPQALPLAIHGSDRDIAISPDGRTIAYRSQAHLVMRALDRFETRPLETVSSLRQPFFSPDGKWIGFFDGGGLKKVAVAGGRVITVHATQSVPRGASWDVDDTIVFATYDASTGLFRVSANGGEATTLSTPDVSKGEDHWHPSALPGGRGVLFTIAVTGAPEKGRVAVLDSRTGQTKTLMPGSQAQYVDTGHLLFMRDHTLSAVPFNLEKLEVTGPPVGVLEDVWRSPSGAANFAVSKGGTLLYVRPSASTAPRALVWIDRGGKETAIQAPPRAYREARISPDGTRVALGVRDDQDDLYVWDIGRTTLTRLTFDPGLDQRPVWTPDGRFIIFGSMREDANGLYIQASDGTGTVRRLSDGQHQHLPAFVTPDWSTLVGIQVPPKTNGDVVRFPFSKPGTGANASSLAPATPLLATGFIEWNPDISPDGRYMAYQSNESGRDEIYVRPFPRVDDGRWQVSANGGVQPLWSPKGGELVYLDRSRAMIAVPVDTTSATFAFGNPVKLFDAPTGDLYLGRDFDISRDGQRFLMIKEAAAQNMSAAPMVLVVNWFEELKAKVALR